MRKPCNLAIHLDAEDETYRYGDSITGTLELAPPEEVTQTVLTLSLQWQTHGLGHTADGDPDTVVLYKGSLPADRLQRYAFSFDAPAGPLTYHGEHLHVTWHLVAHADIPWAVDATVERAIRLAGTASTPLTALFPDFPGGDYLAVLLNADPEAFKAGRASNEQLMQFRRQNRATRGLGQRIFNFFGGLMVVMGLASLITNLDVGIPLTLFGAVFWGFSRFVFGMIGRIETSLSGPEDAEVLAEPALLRPGDSVRFTIRLPEDTRGVQGMATLQGEETVAFRPSPGSTRYPANHEPQSYTFHEASQRLETSRLPSGEALQATFRLPTDAPCSFNASGDAIQWSIRFDVDIEGQPDPWHGTTALIVRP